MPIYEYRCKECQQVFEEWCKRIEDEKVTHVCPICKGQADRLISNTSFALKGGGWYVTEYGSHKGKGQEDKAPSAPSAESKTAAETPATSPAPAKSEAPAKAEAPAASS